MKAYGLTDKGAIRSENQDRFRVFEGENCCAVAVCDGMGGAKAGSVAAELATDAFMHCLERCINEAESRQSGTILREAASFANIRVYDKSKESEEYEGMGCTLVAALVRDESVAVINIGDSRCYHFSDQGLRQLTIDHSLVEEMVQSGRISREEAKTHPWRNYITRAVGLEYRVQGDLFYPKLLKGDTLLLCSDGLSGVLSHKTIEEVLFSCPELESAARKLMDLTLQAGAPDNITVLLLRV